MSNALGADESPAGGGESTRSPEEVSATIPDFEILKLLGRGGMGAVYEARQRSLDRAAAVKLLPPELLRSEEFFERFQREARIMAQLDHPNVARVFASGITDAGDAYIAMELIRGEPITTYARERRLTLRERLELFRQVCNGVQHAHQKGVIHRDLKPSNILVAEIEGRGIPKVIDFGLAKPVEQSAGDEAVWMSARHAVGTPAYMSPEQAAGHDVDSRSDIYSLGILLFELLVGRPPIDDSLLLDASRSAVAQTIRTAPIRRPSEAISGKLREGDIPAVCAASDGDALRGDLDAIVLNALAKDPAQRYQNVVALPEDIQRYLIHQPVAAVVPTAGYVLKKFCRRHWAGLSIAIGIAALFFAGVGLIVRESILTRRAERLAAERLRQGERLIEFMLGDLHKRLQTVGRLDVLEAVVGEIETFYGETSETNAATESLRNRGRAMLQLGRIRLAQGKPEVAEADYRESIRLYEAALARRPEAMNWRKELAETWNSLAVFHHSRAQWEAAEAGYREALGLAGRLTAFDIANGEWADFEASLLQNYGALCEALARLDEAEEKFTKALGIWQRLKVESPGDARLLDHLSHVYLNLAFLNGRRGNLERVIECNAEALKLREQVVQLDTNNAPALSLLADIQQNISEEYLRQGNLGMAEDFLNRYRPVREQLVARDPRNAQWQHRLADAWRNYAVLQTRRGNLDAAGDAHRNAWTISESQAVTPVTPGSPGEKWIRGLNEAEEVFKQLAEREQGQGNLSTAEQHRETLDAIRAKLARATNAFR